MECIHSAFSMAYAPVAFCGQLPKNLLVTNLALKIITNNLDVLLIGSW